MRSAAAPPRTQVQPWRSEPARLRFGLPGMEHRHWQRQCAARARTEMRARAAYARIFMQMYQLRRMLGFCADLEGILMTSVMQRVQHRCAPRRMCWMHASCFDRLSCSSLPRPWHALSWSAMSCAAALVRRRTAKVRSRSSGVEICGVATPGSAACKASPGFGASAGASEL